METKFNFNSQVCTDKNQSERLLALGLKKETADMHYWESEGKIYTYVGQMGDPNGIPAWSLHRLLLLIPKEVNIEGYRFPSRFSAIMRMAEADDMYEYLIDVLEREINGGYLNKEYLV